MSKNSHRKEVIAGVGLTILALVISVFAYFESRFPGDLEITLLFQSIHSRALLTAMDNISYATSEWRAAVLVIISGIVVWRCLGRLEGSQVAAAGLVLLLIMPSKLRSIAPGPHQIW